MQYFIIDLERLNEFGSYFELNFLSDLMKTKLRKLESQKPTKCNHMVYEIE